MTFQLGIVAELQAGALVLAAPHHTIAGVELPVLPLAANRSAQGHSAQQDPFRISLPSTGNWELCPFLSSREKRRIQVSFSNSIKDRGYSES